MTLEIGLVLLVIGVASVLLITEKLRVDVVGILVMVSVAWLGLVTPQQAFSGLASNAVVAVIAVMILSSGLDRAGVTVHLTGPILKLAGKSESRLLALVSATVGGLSAFMQNVGAAALFLPALMRLSKTHGLSLPRLLMPMGFAAILGGTLTMVGSGPLIILNDLLRQQGQNPYGLFSVTPIGLALLAGGILYFVALGRRVLPSPPQEAKASPQQELIEAWRLTSEVTYFRVPTGSSLIGMSPESAGMWPKYSLHLLAMDEEGETMYAPWRHTAFSPGQQLAILGRPEDAARFGTAYDLEAMGAECRLRRPLQGWEAAGFAELIVHPRSRLRGKSLRQIALRRNYAIEPILLLGGTVEERGDFSDTPLEAGATMVVFGEWQTLNTLTANRDFVVATSIEGGMGARRRPLLALACFLLGISLAVSGVQLSLGLFTGALAMILLRVITVDEAYRAVDWRTVFLLAGLIPLGIAMESTGAATFIAGNAVGLVEAAHPILLFLTIGVLSTVFSLFMSNVAATVLLVPLAVSIAAMMGVDPRPLALLVAVCASNSFILPTHQVNALLMAPGGYHNRDYVKAGGLMSVVFLTIAVTLTYLFYV